VVDYLPDGSCSLKKARGAFHAPGIAGGDSHHRDFGRVVAAFAGQRQRTAVTPPPSAPQPASMGAHLSDVADDNDDYLPRRGQGVQVLFQIDRPEDWFNALPPYFASETFQTFGEHREKTGRAMTNRSSSAPPPMTQVRLIFFPYCMNMNLSPWSLPRASNFGEVIQPASVVAMADTLGPYASTFPSTKSYSPVARHAQSVTCCSWPVKCNQLFAGSYVGCGVGDPKNDDVRWLTGTGQRPASHHLLKA